MKIIRDSFNGIITSLGGGAAILLPLDFYRRQSAIDLMRFESGNLIYCILGGVFIFYYYCLIMLINMCWKGEYNKANEILNEGSGALLTGYIGVLIGDALLYQNVPSLETLLFSSAWLYALLTIILSAMLTVKKVDPENEQTKNTDPKIG